MKFRDGPVIPGDEALKPGDDIWRDAEEYLEYLDGAAEAFQPVTTETPPSNKALASRIEGLLQRLGYATPPKITDLHDTARRIIAAECCGFW